MGRKLLLIIPPKVRGLRSHMRTQPLYPYVIWIRLIKLKHLWSGETKQLKLEKQEQKRLAEKVYWLNWGEFQAIPLCPPKYYAHYVSQDSHGEIFPKLIVRWQRRFACSWAKIEEVALLYLTYHYFQLNLSLTNVYRIGDVRILR